MKLFSVFFTTALVIVTVKAKSLDTATDFPDIQSQQTPPSPLNALRVALAGFNNAVMDLLSKITPDEVPEPRALPASPVSVQGPPVVSVQEPTRTPECPAVSFKCFDGQCISLSFRCDGKKDCADGEDEYCETYKRSVDGENTEYDNERGTVEETYYAQSSEEEEDESSGVEQTYESDKTYESDLTFSTEQVSDDMKPYGDDIVPYSEDDVTTVELTTPQAPSYNFTTTECAKHQFRCEDGTCIPGIWKCDGIRDCPNDELECDEKETKH